MRLAIFSCAFIVLSFGSCKGNSEKSFDSLMSSAKQTYIQGNEQSLTLSQEDLYVSFSNKMQSVVKELNSLTPKEGNKLYGRYRKEIVEYLLKINEFEHFSLRRYYSEDADSKNMIKQLSEKLRRNHLMIRELGEGEADIVTVPDFFYTIFDGHVTDDLDMYLDIKMMEDKEPYAADAALLISFSKLSARILRWERFLDIYPKSCLAHRVKKLYRRYQIDYLFGMDNTPTVDRFNPDSIYVYFDNKQEFDRFMKAHPDSPTSKLIAFFLDNFNKENVKDLIRKQQQKL